MTTLCVVFDLDDTLYLERDYVRSGFQAVGEWAQRWLEIPDFATRAWSRFQQGKRGNIFDAVLADLGWEPNPALVASLVWVYRTHRPAIKLLPDAADCLAALNGKALPSIITDGPLVSQTRKIEALDLDKVADPIVITEKWGVEFAKPHPRAFLALQDHWKGENCEFVYVADNPIKDFAIPRSFGWLTVRVRRPGGLYQTVANQADCEPDIEVSDLRNLLPLLNNCKQH